ncbi:MAG TPA: stage II sporulation protein M [Candidatus Angelobacter sp.]|nr:stage II sporulation protein M [Candidatus Angelobacter sp.]
MISLSLGTMISTYWLEKRQSHWRRLEQLLDRVEHSGLRSLTRTELQEMGLLYRQAAADLSTLREDATGKSYARTLNLLLSRAHNTIYTGEKSSARGILHFYRYTYPQIFRNNLKLINLALLLFVVGAAIGTLLTLTRPEYMRYFLGPHMMETIEHHKMWTDSVVTVSPWASSAIMTNNITVSFMMFAWGITAGVLTVFSLIYNGILMGVIGTACWFNDMSLSLWSFVAPHGVLELPAIFIAGGSGLRLAQGLLFPGLHSRQDSLAKAGGEAIRLLMGVVPILIFAGLIEGFISPSSLGWQWKFALAGSVAVVFFSYLFFCARGGSERLSTAGYLAEARRFDVASSTH